MSDQPKVDIIIQLLGVRNPEVIRYLRKCIFPRFSEMRFYNDCEDFKVKIIPQVEKEEKKGQRK